jgi:Holliday junction resolvase RusA-like endonuclease
MKTVEFTINKTPPSLNTMLKMHWAKRYKEQEKWDLMVYAIWLKHNREVFFNPITIKYRLVFTAVRDRDFDNYYGGIKFINDALKRTFLLRDDASWLRKPEIFFESGPAKCSIITIEEVVNE